MTTTLKKPKISIIVPVYNVEKYLRQCLDSLAAQTMQDIEVIIINNNSPDNSAVIIDEYIKKYQNFVTYHKVGGGLSGARNEGLKHANGDYIIFLDSDDWVSADMCEKLYNTAIKETADIVCCEFYFASEDSKELRPNNTVNNPPFTLSREKDGTIQILKAGGNLGSAWRKIIRSGIILDNNLTFPENKLFEDVAFICTCFILSDKIAVIRDLLWYYRYVPTSISNTKRMLAPQSIFYNFGEMRAFLKTKGLYPLVEEEYEYRLLLMLIGGEGVGNGGVMNLDKEHLKAFFALSRDFYLSLPDGLFNKRNALFKLKFFFFRFFLKHNLYSLRWLSRATVNIFAAVYLPLFGRGNK